MPLKGRDHSFEVRTVCNVRKHAKIAEEHYHNVKRAQLKDEYDFPLSELENAVDKCLQMCSSIDNMETTLTKLGSNVESLMNKTEILKGKLLLAKIKVQDFSKRKTFNLAQLQPSYITRHVPPVTTTQLLHVLTQTAYFNRNAPSATITHPAQVITTQVTPTIIIPQVILTSTVTSNENVTEQVKVIDTMDETATVSTEALQVTPTVTTTPQVDLTADIQIVTPTVDLTGSVETPSAAAGSDKTPSAAAGVLPTGLSIPIQVPISQIVSQGMPQVVTGSIHWGRVLKGTHKFFCDVCNNPFTKKSDIKTTKEHSCGDSKAEKKYACSYCGKKFAYEQLMKDHENEKHTGLKPYTCDYCKETFSTKYKVVAHRKVCPMKYFSPSLQNLSSSDFNFVQ